MKFFDRVVKYAPHTKAKIRAWLNEFMIERKPNF